MNIHDHYQKMKCVISADKSQPDKALSLIKDDFVVNLKDMTLEHQEWHKNRVVGTTNHCAVVAQEVGWTCKNWISWCDYLWAGKSQTEGEEAVALKAWNVWKLRQGCGLEEGTCGWFCLWDATTDCWEGSPEGLTSRNSSVTHSCIKERPQCKGDVENGHVCKYLSCFLQFLDFSCLVYDRYLKKNAFLPHRNYSKVLKKLMKQKTKRKKRLC